MVWFDSTAFEEYAEMLCVDGYLGIKGFKKAQKLDLALTFHNYLLLKHNCFLVRLITCQFCATVWLSIGACLYIGFVYFPFLTILSYTIYGGVIKINERF
jgi:hypothetical protein